MKKRQRWLNTLSWQYSRLLDAFGLHSPLAVACVRWAECDPQAQQALVSARLLRMILGSELRSKGKDRKGQTPRRGRRAV